MHRAARHEHLAASYRAMRDHYQQQGQAVAQTMADRQALKAPTADPGRSGLDTLFSARRTLAQAAILQLPKPSHRAFGQDPPCVPPSMMSSPRREADRTTMCRTN